MTKATRTFAALIGLSVLLVGALLLIMPVNAGASCGSVLSPKDFDAWTDSELLMSTCASEISTWRMISVALLVFGFLIALSVFIANEASRRDEEQKSYGPPPQVG